MLRFVQETIGFLAAHYLQLVWRTTRLHVEPANIYEQITPQMPIIVAMWHGQHFLMPFIRRPQDRAKVLVSTHRDGEINAITARRLGTGTIRGSGTHGMDFHKKGGVSAFHEMLKALADGYNLALTADVPKVARVAGLGERLPKIGAIIGANNPVDFYERLVSQWRPGTSPDASGPMSGEFLRSSSFRLPG